MRITSDWMHQLGVVDSVVSEPLGGAHRDPVAAIDALGDAFAAQLDSMAGMDGAALIADRNDKYMRIGDNGLD
jgi:acetyl-CoA carboxylase carboxyl transferase subunit alpha